MVTTTTANKVKHKTPQLPKVKTKMINLGCDPEFFFKVNNRVVGAEMFIPEKGMKTKAESKADGRTHKDMKGKSKFIIDGVQAELNPRPNTCRANLANELQTCFKTLGEELKKSGKKVEVSFKQTVTISPTELAKLDEKNQKFGCKPSNSSYGKDTSVELEQVDPLTMRNRSAGGHIHIGFGTLTDLKTAIKQRPDEMVQLLDIICGNTCVLVDRDTGNKKRRELYGRAGEYRLPEHGIEYRTLSNFWLQSYPLMSLAFGLARTAAELSCDKEHHKDYYKAFTDAVDMDDIQRAINTNNYPLALKNFKKIEGLLMEITSESTHFAFHRGNIEEFHHFHEKVRSHGIQYWFKEDTMEHWANLPEAHKDGMCYFLENTVRKDMQKKT